MYNLIDCQWKFYIKFNSSKLSLCYVKSKTITLGYLHFENSDGKNKYSNGKEINLYKSKDLK